MVREKIIEILKDALKNLESEGLNINGIELIVEVPKQKEYGDYATPIPLLLAQKNQKPPLEIAYRLIDKLTVKNIFEKVEIAGPGFINFFVSHKILTEVMYYIRKDLENFVKTPNTRKKIQVEFGSINPTGPMHIAHARGVVIGDSLANLFRRIGWYAEKEFYINDAGNQIDLLGESLYARYLEIQGIDYEFPKDGYKGEYLKDLAYELLREKDKINAMNEKEKKEFFKEYALRKMLENIKKTLQNFGVEYDCWFSEKSLHKEGKLKEVLEILDKNGYIYKKDSAIWFSSTKFGDESDRVLIKRDGSPTYFLADIAYHLNKIERGFDWIIDVWGADHHAHVQRMKSSLQALGYSPQILDVILVQMVRLLRGKEEVKISKRTGDFITLEEVQEEVGKDPIRFFFLLRSADSQLDFDIELAKKQANDNPVYYVQYAHARCCSILKQAEERGIDLRNLDFADLSLLKNKKEKELLILLMRYPDKLRDIARTLEIHLLPHYLLDLATAFHAFYDSCRVLSQDKELTLARLNLVDCVRIIINDGLKILGISSPEKM
ncbi:MAG: arginine--tRNA ligase [Dictyoglomus sp.]|nr:arginine--tRNA ligase [Dictyoglomus sp.]MCX7941993.1 arginine--tRNA ligase [Dictyoglomaceae bacterium]MDW8188745.1 arginine--tRNA ligase [Dictyoglomus sp.]